MDQTTRQHYRGMFSRPALLVSVTVAVSAACWVLFVGSMSLHEMEVGAVVLVLTGLFCRTMFRNATLPFEPRWADKAELRRIPVNLVVDCWTVFIVLMRDLAGRPPRPVFETAPFASSLHDPDRIERMVLATSYLTMTPNSIVIGIDPAQSLILYHQLERTPIPKLVETLGAPR